MIVAKRHKHRHQSPTPLTSPSRKLFVDYPYPILTELTKAYTQPKKSDHSYALVSLRWYKDNFQKLFGLSHHLSNHGSPTSILEQSARQVHADKRASTAIVNNSQTQNKPIHVKRILAGSMSAPINDQEEINKTHFNPE